MQLQIIKDGYGNNTGVFVPMSDWNTLIQKHEDLRALVPMEPVAPKKKLSDLAGKLSKETADAMQQEIDESRNDWEERLKKQF
jgi:hypothetical protein